MIFNEGIEFWKHNQSHFSQIFPLIKSLSFGLGENLKFPSALSGIHFVWAASVA